MMVGGIRLLIVSAVIAACTGPIVADREVVNFDFGWKFSTSQPTPTPCKPHTFPTNLTGVECMGLNHVGVAQTVDDCMSFCCNQEGCNIWQFASPASDPKLGCWIGQSSNCAQPSQAWQGGGRSTAPSPPIPPMQPQAAWDYDDTAWPLVDVPHDFIIGNDYDATQPGSGRSYLPRSSGWYRKHFYLPEEWKGTTITLRFEGVFRESYAWINGQPSMVGTHTCGYTSFDVRVDNLPNITYGRNGDVEANVIALFVDALTGSGWWYEGGGIYRDVSLISTSAGGHIVSDSLHTMYSGLQGPYTAHSASEPSKGSTATTATLAFDVEVIARNNNPHPRSLSLRCAITDATGTLVASGQDHTTVDGAGATALLHCSRMSPVANAIELWSIPRPYLHQVHVSVLDSATMMVLDSLNQTLGMSAPEFSGQTGFSLNAEPIKVRGFCDHASFAGVGMAVPPRVNLYRAQSLRSVGGNARRTSHNPADPALLDIYDRVGVIVMEENRLFGNVTAYVTNMGDMVRRDRHHASIFIWSFCNEAGCSGQLQDGAAAFQEITKHFDPSRSTLANMFSFNDELGNTIDIQGFSHKPASEFDTFHQQFPFKPVCASECCSCTTMRAVDVANASDPAGQTLANNNLACVSSQTNYSYSREFVSGTFVWTLFDYYGEPCCNGWPHRSSSFGSFDLSGFAKAAVYWYRSWWLSAVKETAWDRPPVGPQPLVHIVEGWETEGDTKRTVHVYSASPKVELLLNGASVGVQSVPYYGGAAFTVQFAPGNLTAVATDDTGAVSATHSVFTRVDTGKTLRLGLDVPSVATGTGTHLYADGLDVAMIRVSVVDAQGHLVRDGGDVEIEFAIKSGPGRLVGVGNGDPRAHENNKGNKHTTFHGLARCLVQVTEDHATTARLRERMLFVDKHTAGTRVSDPRAPLPLVDIVVTATAAGLGSADLTIPVSADASHHFLAVAERSLALANFAK